MHEQWEGGVGHLGLIDIYVVRCVNRCGKGLSHLLCESEMASVPAPMPPWFSTHGLCNYRGAAVCVCVCVICLIIPHNNNHFLQVWKRDDFNYLVKELELSLPHYHYFHW